MREVQIIKRVVQDKLDEFISDIMLTMDEIKAAYPINGSFGLGKGYGHLN